MNTTGPGAAGLRSVSRRFLVAFLLTAVGLGLCAPAFAPGHAAAGAFSSDEAIPVLMANSPRHTGYELFYWGQDRFGTWPFELASLFARAGGVVTPGRLFSLLVVALVLAVVLFARLAAELAPVVAASLVALIVLERDVGRWTFSLGQPYAWQFLALAASWIALRALATRPSLGGAVVVLVATTLAFWISPLDIPLLVLAAATELAPALPRMRTRAGALALVALGIAGGAQAWMARLHRVSSDRQGLWFQRTAQQLDLAHLAENIVAIARQLLGTPSGWIVLGAALLLPFALRKRTGDLRLRALGLAAVLGAWTVIAALTVTSWMRLNAYEPRYLAPARFLAMVGFVALLAHVVPAARRVLWPATAALLTATLLLRPANGLADDQANRIATADALAAHAPMVLFGSYWELYVFSGLRPDAAIVPANIEREFDRMGFTRAALRSAREVVVGHAGTARFGPPGSPVPFIFEDKVLLELAEPQWLTAGGRSFSRYLNRTADALAIQLPPEAHAANDRSSGSLWIAEPLAHASGSVDVRFEPRSGARLVIVLGEVGQAPAIPKLRAVALDAAGQPKGDALELRGALDVLEVELPESLGPLGGVRVISTGDAQPAPAIRELFVLPTRP